MVELGLLAVGLLAVLFATKKAGTMKATAYFNGQPQEIEIKSIGSGLYLQADAANAFNQMSSDALSEGFGIIPSGHRSAFRTQEMQIELLRELGRYGDTSSNGEPGYAAAAGYSPHQKGAAVDLANVNPWGLNYLPEVRAWLLRNGPKYGWHNTGASFKTPEPWHFEWRKP